MRYLVASLVIGTFVLFSFLEILGCRGRDTPEQPPPAEQDDDSAPGVKVIFKSPTECEGNHGVWRWAAKTETTEPPDIIDAAHQITVPDVDKWDPPYENIGTNSPRTGKEREWFQLTGRVQLIRAEADGDLHIQLTDGKLSVVVEVPLGAPWGAMREKVFALTDQKFPFEVESEQDLKLLPVDSDPATKRPVIRVVGRAFYDAIHSMAGRSKRRLYDRSLTVWEIHPVMKLEILYGP